MDVLSHSAHGVIFGTLIGGLVGHTLELQIIFGVIGAAPDIIGFLEKVVNIDGDSWNWYEEAHYLTFLLIIVPPYFLHVLLDKYTHEEGKRWWVKGERLWAEILNVAITLALLWILVL